MRLGWPAANVFAHGIRKWRERKGEGRKERTRTESHSCAETSSNRSVQESPIRHAARLRTITFPLSPLRREVVPPDPRTVKETTAADSTFIFRDPVFLASTRNRSTLPQTFATASAGTDDSPDTRTERTPFSFRTPAIRSGIALPGSLFQTIIRTWSKSRPTS